MAAAWAGSVCVIVPAHNAERYLLAAVHSVLDQTHQAFELVIVDDGSDDGTLQLARRIGDSRASVLSGPNRGRAHARNRGLAAARPSEFVAFLDADDEWDPPKLEIQIAELRAHPALVGVGSFMRYISSRGEVLGETGQRIGAADLSRIARGELAPFPISSCLLARRSCVADIGGFDDRLREAEDLDFLARLARRGPIGCIPRALGSYRIHPHSAMARARAQVNLHARFVRARLAARDRGGDLDWEVFRRAPPTWREQYHDRVGYWYRSAALWRGERDMVRALGYAVLVCVAAPHYALRRWYRQRGSV